MKGEVPMTRIDTHSVTLLARRREAELHRELHLRRLVREAQACARPVEPTYASAVPVARAWLRLIAGQRPSGA
jgi:hypothetical protein